MAFVVAFSAVAAFGGILDRFAESSRATGDMPSIEGATLASTPFLVETFPT